LDPVSAYNPVCLSDFTGGHIAWVNTEALRHAGISRDTPDPVGGSIVRDTNTGETTGALNEPAASNLVQSFLPLSSEQETRQGLTASMQELNALGLTSLTEPGLGLYHFIGMDCDNALTVLNDLHNEGLVTVRVGVLLTYTDYLEGGALSLNGLSKSLENVPTRTGFGDGWLRISGVKLAADSMPPNKTAWMYDEYVGRGNGQLVVAGLTDEQRYRELIEMIVYASNRGLQFGVHATGDRAIDACVDGFVHALLETRWDALVGRCG